MPARFSSDVSERRAQLAHLSQATFDSIIDPPIATAQAIITQVPNPSPELRGTAAKYLAETLATLCGCTRAPLNKMRRLMLQLAPPNIDPYLASYPIAELPSSVEDELLRMADEALHLMPYLKTDEAKEVSHKMLNWIDRLYPMRPAELKRHIKVFTRFVDPPAPIPTDDAHQASIENFRKEIRASNVIDLLKAKPQGRA